METIGTLQGGTPERVQLTLKAPTFVRHGQVDQASGIGIEGEDLIDPSRMLFRDLGIFGFGV